MKTIQLGLETILRDIQLEDIQKLYLEIKDKARLNPGEESIIKEGEIENGEKWNKERLKEVDIENEMKLKTIDNQFKEKIKIENKEIEKLYIERKEKNREKIYIKKEDKLKDELKLNKGFQINNIKNSSNDELNLIIEKNNTIKNYIINLLFLIMSLYSCKRREEKILNFQGEAPRIKISKDKNGFFEDKNKSGKYLKESIMNWK